LVRTLPRHSLESRTVTARLPRYSPVPAIVFKHLHESSCLFRAGLSPALACAGPYIGASIHENPSRRGFLVSVLEPESRWWIVGLSDPCQFDPKDERTWP
jgi:hypothetical protein